MAKTRSGRYSSYGSFGERMRQSIDQRRKEKEQKEKNPKKYKRNKAIAEALKDSKISKKEAKSLAKKGINLANIKNRNIKEYQAAQQAVAEANRNRNTDRRTYDYPSPSFKPLMISSGAERVFGRAQQAPPPPMSPLPPPHIPPPPPKTKKDNIQKTADKIKEEAAPEEKPDPVANALTALQQSIASFKMPDYSSDIEELKADQENYMKELAAQQLEAERQRELSFRTSQENIARSGLTPDFRIGARSSRDRFGTSAFRRRPRYTSTTARGIAPTTAAQTLNI